MNQSVNKHQSSLLRSLLISLISFFVFSLGVIPAIVFSLFSYQLIINTGIWQIIIIPFILYIAAGILFLTELFFSGFVVALFRITYEPGIYDYSLKNKNAFHWVIICTLYTPLRKLLEMFPMGRIKNAYFRLLGMKIGTNTLVGGVIKDPCLTEFGDNTTMGEYAIIYGHIHNTEEGTITMDRVKIGNNCVIGAGAIIMPGAHIEDDVIIAAGALVPKNKRLTKGKIYGGVPVKEIGVKKTPSSP